MLPDFKAYYLAIEIKRAWYWKGDSHIDQQIRVENSGLDPHISTLTNQE